METPVVSVHRPARDVQGDPAGIVSRVFAAIVDLVVVAVLLGSIVGLLVLMRYLFGSQEALPSSVDSRLSGIGGTALLIAYLGTSWSLNGRTVGQHVFGLRIVDRAGRGVRPARAFVRALLCCVFPIGLAWCVLSRDRRSVQDLVAGTAVVYDWSVRRVDD